MNYIEEQYKHALENFPKYIYAFYEPMDLLTVIGKKDGKVCHGVKLEIEEFQSFLLTSLNGMIENIQNNLPLTDGFNSIQFQDGHSTAIELMNKILNQMKFNPEGR